MSENTKTKAYKYCIVPKCTNTTKKTPNKIFFSVPKDAKMRKKWCRIMKRDDRVPFSNLSTLYCCEDHFNIEEDMLNYVKYKLVGGMVRLKKEVLPHKFHCQKDTKETIPKPAYEKRRRIEFYERVLSKNIPAPSYTQEADFADCGQSKDIIVDDTPMDPIALPDICLEGTKGIDMDKICRSCLATDATDVAHNADYQEFYQQITNVPFQDDSGKPTSLCHECLNQFRKCMQLRDKCLKADRILNELLANGVGISPKSILSINRSEHLLTSKCTNSDKCTHKLGTEHHSEEDIKIENDNDEVPKYVEDSIITENCEEDPSDNGDIDCTDGQEKVDHLNSDESKGRGSSDNDNRIVNTPYMCQFCAYRSSKKSDVVKHTRTHTREKPYKCDFCNYEASQKVHLVHHRRTHTGDKPYKCHICIYKFSRKEHLVRHITAHTEEKPYKCDICNVRYSLKGSLVRHIRTHT